MGKAYILNPKQADLVICIGAANIDYKLTALEPMVLGTSNPIHSNLSMGGVIRNVAENCGRLDMNVALISIIGEDNAGQSILDHMNGLCSTLRINKLDAARTGAYYAVLDNNGELVTGLADMEICDHMDRAWICRHESYLKQANLIVADTNVKPDCIEYLLELSQAHGKKLIIVGVSSIKMNRLPAHAFELYGGIFNLDESQSYFGVKEDAHALAKRWIDHGLAHIIITQGTKPVIYANRQEILSFPIFPAERIVDVTGAGDSFIAGCLYGLNKQLSFKDSIPYGLTNSHHTVQHQLSVRTNLSATLLEEEKEQLTHA